MKMSTILHKTLLVGGYIKFNYLVKPEFSAKFFLIFHKLNLTTIRLTTGKVVKVSGIIY